MYITEIERIKLTPRYSFKILDFEATNRKSELMEPKPRNAERKLGFPKVPIIGEYKFFATMRMNPFFWAIPTKLSKSARELRIHKNLRDTSEFPKVIPMSRKKSARWKPINPLYREANPKNAVKKSSLINEETNPKTKSKEYKVTIIWISRFELSKDRILLRVIGRRENASVVAMKNLGYTEGSQSLGM
jgi:hypothetical protein